MKKFILLMGIGLLGILLSPSSQASEWDQKTVVTFSAPVEIPGKVLGAGTYVFKLLDSTTNRDIVQIWNKDETQLIATILALPNMRLTPTDKPVINFEERPQNSPEAIRAWFYPGRLFGEQFVYPKSRATELAKVNQQPVLSMANDLTPNITKATDSATGPEVTAMKQANVEAINRSGESVNTSRVITAPTRQQMAAEKPATSASENVSSGNPGLTTTVASATPPKGLPKHLPKTGSMAPLASVIGGLLIGAACMLGFGSGQMA